MDYTYIQDLQLEFQVPEKGISSRVLEKNDNANVTLLGFAAGEELSSHSAATPAILYFIEGTADVRLGHDTVTANAGSFVYMPPKLPHAIAAKSATRMLLVQVKVAAH
jgi:quercetin dioxygenase-like cupin family protein